MKLLTLFALLSLGCGEDEPVDDSVPEADADTDTDADTDSDTDADADSDADSDTDSDTDTDTEAYERGKTVFQGTCGGDYCHGADGDVGGAADLSVKIPEKSDEEIVDIIENGTGYMSPVGLSEAEIADVLVYLRATFP